MNRNTHFDGALENQERFGYDEVSRIFPSQHELMVRKVQRHKRHTDGSADDQYQSFPASFCRICSFNVCVASWNPTLAKFCVFLQPVWRYLYSGYAGPHST